MSEVQGYPKKSNFILDELRYLFNGLVESQKRFFYKPSILFLYNIGFELFSYIENGI
jgi:hypothetical protein